MAQRRSLKSAMADPLVEKKRMPADPAAGRPMPTTARKIGFAVVAAAVVVGFVGGWLARRFLKIV